MARGRAAQAAVPQGCAADPAAATAEGALVQQFAGFLNASQPRLWSAHGVQDAVYPALTPQELAEAGQALYGPAWREELARTFGVSRAEVVRVEKGRTAAPGHWRATLVALAQDTALRALQAASMLLWCEERGEAPSLARPVPEDRPARLV